MKTTKGEEKEKLVKEEEEENKIELGKESVIHNCTDTFMYVYIFI